MEKQTYGEQVGKWTEPIDSNSMFDSQQKIVWYSFVLRRPSRMNECVLPELIKLRPPSHQLTAINRCCWWLLCTATRICGIKFICPKPYLISSESTHFEQHLFTEQVADSPHIIIKDRLVLMHKDHRARRRLFCGKIYIGCACEIVTFIDITTGENFSTSRSDVAIELPHREWSCLCLWLSQHV